MGTSLIRNTPLLGPYRRTIHRVLWWSWGGGAVSYERGTPVGSLELAYRRTLGRCVPLFNISEVFAYVGLIQNLKDL